MFGADPDATYGSDLIFFVVLFLSLMGGAFVSLQDEQAARMGLGTAIMGCKEDDKVKVKELVEVRRSTCTRYDMICRRNPSFSTPSNHVKPSCFIFISDALL